MHIIKNIILNLLGLFFLTAGFGVLLLFLNVGQSFVAWLGASAVVIASIVLAIVRIAKAGENGRKKLTSAIFLMGSSILFWIFTLFLFGTNFLLYDVEYELTEATELTPAAKLSYYRQLVTGDDGTIDLAKLDSREIDGITFYFAPGSEPSEEMGQLVELIESNHPQLERELGGETDAEVSFVLYGEGLDMPIRETIQAEYSGFYKEHNQTIHLPLPVYKVSALHEYAHHLFFSIAKDRGMSSFDIPAWFAEGVATYVSEKGHTLPYDSMQTAEYVAFEKLEQIGGWENHLPHPYSPYFQSRAFVEYMVGQEGDSLIQKILAEMANSPFPKSFEQVTGKTVQSYEAEFLADFEQVPGLWSEAAQFDIDKDFEASLNKYLEVAEIAPNMESLNHRISNLYLELWDYEKAIGYSRKELELKEAASAESLSAAYSYLAISLLFADIQEAQETALKGVETLPEERNVWSEGVLAEVDALKQDIENGTPLKGYLKILNGEYIFNEGLENQKQKMMLIDVALERHPEGGPADRAALLQLRKSLEQHLNSEN